MQNLPFDSFPPDSRVWVYQSNKKFDSSQLEILNNSLEGFIKNWTAHNQALKASYQIRYDRFIILMVDESLAGASGCSIDASVHFMEKLEKLCGIDLFDRMLFAFESEKEVVCLGKKEFESALQMGRITRETIVFNNLVRTKSELDSMWRVPLKESWFGNYFAQPIKKETWS